MGSSRSALRRRSGAALALTGSVASLTVLGAGSTPAPAQEPGEGDRWTRQLAFDLSASDLGLRADAPARTLARAGLERSARRLGLPRSLRGLRPAGVRHVARGPNGARELDLLRFHQTVRGTRVLWSQIDVAIAAGRVSSISATVVPATGERLAGKRRVSRERAVRIAGRAVGGSQRALQPLPVAYAGKPTVRRSARLRTPRRAWVVEATPAAALDAEVPVPVCIVIDAETGRVIARWSGIADRPDRGPQARGGRTARAHRPTADRASARTARAPRPTARRASARAAQNPVQFLLEIWDGSHAAEDRTDPFAGTTAYASFAIARDPHRGVNWPPFLSADPWNKPCTQRLAPVPCLNFLAPRNAAIDVVATNARNAAFTVCAVRDFCGRLHGLQGDSGNYFPWDVIANGKKTRAFPADLAVEIAPDAAMDGCPGPNQCVPDPRGPFNDLIAHEFGHVMDLVYAGDRALGDLDLQADSVAEALADMFAYDYDRADAILGEDAPPLRINWAQPGNVFLGSQRYPAHMLGFDPTPPLDDDRKPDVHFNSTILSHAYYLFVQDVGHDRAGNVLQYVPFTLSPKPTFKQVAQGFHQRAGDLYGDDVAVAAANAFAQVGLPPVTHEEPDCGPIAC
jgi:hypothetical protein